MFLSLENDQEHCNFYNTILFYIRLTLVQFMNI